MKKLLALALLASTSVPAMAAEPIKIGTDIEADGSTTLFHETLIDAQVKDLWPALSTAEGWMTWAAPIAWASPADPDLLETSYSKTDKPGSPATVQQRFTARIPGRMLAFKTIKVPAGFPNGADYLKVSSVFELQPEGARTRLRLTSVGYPDSEGGKALVAFFTEGNAIALEALQKRFTDGPVDWNKALGGN